MSVTETIEMSMTFEQKPIASSPALSLTFEDALAYLDAFINFERKMPGVYLPENVDPGRGRRLLEALNAPHNLYPSLHIAGSKGKGSVAAMCASCLQAAGLRVGFYSSPHLVHIRERIRVLTPDDPLGYIKEDTFAALVSQMVPYIEEVPGITWFEIVTALAFLHFSREQVDVAVVEVGLGGRLDATNVLSPLVTVITRISYEHTGLLGETLGEIAGEKAGILKPGTVAVTAPQHPEALASIVEMAQLQGAPLIRVGIDLPYVARPADPPYFHLQLSNWSKDGQHKADGAGSVTFRVGLAGRHQVENAAVAVAALQVAQAHFPGLTPDAIRQGLEQVHWPGRLQMLQEHTDERPGILLDGAHTVDSAAWLAIALRESFRYERLWLILGITRGKDIAGILSELLPLATGAVAVRATHPRSLPPEELQSEANSLGFQLETAQDVQAGMAWAMARAGSGDLICVTGSLYVVGDLLNHWERLQSPRANRNPHLEK